MQIQITEFPLKFLTNFYFAKFSTIQLSWNGLYYQAPRMEQLTVAPSYFWVGPSNFYIPIFLSKETTPMWQELILSPWIDGWDKLHLCPTSIAPPNRLAVSQIIQMMFIFMFIGTIKLLSEMDFINIFRFTS